VGLFDGRRDMWRARGHGGVNVTLAPEEGAEERAVPTRKGGGGISRTGA
jgi:hypothetical protein